MIIIPKTQTEKLIVPASRLKTPLSKRRLSLANVSEQRRSELMGLTPLEDVALPYVNGCVVDM